MTKLISAVFKSRVGLPLLLVIENLSQLLDPLLFQTPTMNNKREKTTMHFLYSALFYASASFSTAWKLERRALSPETKKVIKKVVAGRTICCLFHLKSQMLFWFPS